MRINVLQHTPNEGPGAIHDWAHSRGDEMYVYHPYAFGVLPSAAETDMLVILGGPMSPNDSLGWIAAERDLITKLLEAHKPIFGVCYGAQQIALALGYPVTKAPHKEVGWAPVYRQSEVLPGVPAKMQVLHWHEEMFTVPDEATLLFSSELVPNQGFLMQGNVLGLQFHFEPLADNLREIVVNDGEYALDHNDLHQTPAEILQNGVPTENAAVLFKMLDAIAGA